MTVETRHPGQQSGEAASAEPGPISADARPVFLRAQLLPSRLSSGEPDPHNFFVQLPGALGTQGLAAIDRSAVVDVELLQTTDGGVTAALAESITVTAEGGFVYLRLHDRADRVFAVVMLSRAEAPDAAERLLDAAEACALAPAAAGRAH